MFDNNVTIQFQKELDKLGVSNILETPSYSYHGFSNDKDFFKALDDIRDNNLKVLIHGDSDPDGAFGARIFIECCKRLNIVNHEFYYYKERSHVLTNEAVYYAIDNKFDYIVIIDSSTNDMFNISKLISNGIKVIILDHHKPNYTLDAYPDNCIIINTIIENNIRLEDFYRLSGGALTFYVMSEYLRRNNRPYEDLSSYALITLYSDSIDMTKELNRAIYYMATGLSRSSLPIYVKHYLTDYSAFNRRFIEYTFVPKINALFRSEHLDLINKYLFSDNNYSENLNLLSEIQNVYDSCRKLVNQATDLAVRENMENLVIANLSQINLPIQVNKLYNYTGLVANNLSNDYGKPCVVLCDTGINIKGSLRDCMSRNYLTIFQQFKFFKAEGHNAAFGIGLEYRDYQRFMRYIRDKIDKKFYVLGVMEPLEIEYENSIPSVEFLNKVALYNEFSGISVPIAIIKKTNNLKCSKSFSKSYGYVYNWGNVTVSSSKRLPPGYTLEIKPIKGKSLKLVVYNRTVIL